MTPTSIRTRTAAAAVSATAVALLAAACGSGDPAPDAPAEDPAAVDVTAPPQIASWSTFGGIAVPLGREDGPTSTPGAPLTGFTRTPQGAALAAIGQSVQLSTATDSTWSTILPAVTTPGAGRDAYAGNRALIQVSGTDPAVVPSIIGYTLPAYSPDAATVSIIQEFSDDSLAAVAAEVVWSGEDWKLALPEPEREPVPQDFVTAEVAGNPVTPLDAPPADMSRSMERPDERTHHPQRRAARANHRARRQEDRNGWPDGCRPCRGHHPRRDRRQSRCPAERSRHSLGLGGYRWIVRSGHAELGGGTVRTRPGVRCARPRHLRPEKTPTGSSSRSPYRQRAALPTQRRPV